MAAARALFIRERKLAREKGHKAHRNRVGSFALYLRVLDAGDARNTHRMGAVKLPPRRRKKLLTPRARHAEHLHAQPANRPLS